MREILFRGKRTDNNEWVEGFYQEYPEGYVHIQNAANDWFPVIPKTVGQFTGLTDRSGKKIFEGDIVKLDEDVKEIFNVKDGLIKYIGGCFLVDGKGRNNGSMLASLHTLVDINWVLRGVIIGNIHDNPELLEKEITR